MGAFYSSNIQKGNKVSQEEGLSTTPTLKLLNSHSNPQTGEEWVVSFETIGKANLTITPKDQDTVNDMDFISLTCNNEEKTENLNILEGDTIFYPNWQCTGQGELTHLVNIARKHILSFQFSNKIAFAYNNPDSVTDTFADESKVSATTTVVISGGQATLETCTDTGGACSAAGECCTGFCVDSVCCDSACSDTPCYRCDGYSNNGTGTCGYVSTAVDPDNECTPVANSSEGCRSNNCSGTAAADNSNIRGGEISNT